MRFRDRVEAARLLAEQLDKYKGEETVVYALPRGGVVLGVEIARHLNAPLDLLIPRKIGHPSHAEYAVCAVTEEGYLVCDQEELEKLDKDWLKAEVDKEMAEAKRRRLAYLKDRPPVPAQGKTAIIVDDGVATGLTMLAAIYDVRQRHPSKVVIAVPVLPREIEVILEKQADEVIALDVPENYLGSVGAYYKHFEQVEDDEVIKLMEEAAKGAGNE
jgi:putative phosphoribosyl transferase